MNKQDVINKILETYQPRPEVIIVEYHENSDLYRSFVKWNDSEQEVIVSEWTENAGEPDCLTELMVDKDFLDKITELM